MKRILLSAALIVATMGFSQTYDNTSGYYISELIASISGDDAPDEFIELRGEPNALLPTGTYFISIEGDGSSGNLGKVSDVLDLSGLAFGGNGYLTLTMSGSSYEGNFVAMSTNYTEEDVSGYDGNLLDQSASYLLINSTASPSGVVVDSDSDGEFDAMGDHTGWNIYDSVSSLDDDDNAEYGYAQMNVATNYSSTPSIFNAPTGSSFLSPMDEVKDDGSIGAVNVYYIGRQGESTGYDAVSDWMAGQTNSGSTRPFWTFSGTEEKNVPSSLSGTTLEASTIGGPNLDPVDDVEDTASSDDVFAAGLSVYPNPASGMVTIDAGNTVLTSVELFSTLGGQVYASDNTTSVDVSTLAKGVYFLKLNGEGASATKKLIVE